MLSDREKLLAAVLRLSTEDRAAVATALLRSLDEEASEGESVELAWAEEIRRRVQALDDGTLEMLSAEEARALIAADGAEDR